jgi:hypothetical protein
MLHHKLLGLLILAAAPLASADVLLLDGVEMNAQTNSSRPARGMSMARVESQYGSPTDRFAPVGEPPIARWEYPGFTVYFEYDHVIHAVARR